jgi:hypothetical protein
MPPYEIAVLAFCAAPFLAIVLFYCETRVERWVRSRRETRRALRLLQAPTESGPATDRPVQALPSPDASAEAHGRAA